MMNEQLKHFENEPSIFEDLFDLYFDNRGADDERVEAAYKELCHTLLDVDAFQIDAIMSAVALLCMEHERAAFMAGVKTRIRLLKELFM